MKKLLLLTMLLCPLLAFAQSQGTAVRALNGYGTNTLFFNNLGFPIRETADMAAGFLFDYSAGNLSVDWNARKLWDGTVYSIDYFNRNFNGTAWIFLSVTNHNDVSAGAFASGNVWGYDGITAKWTNGPPSFVSLSRMLTNAITMNFDGATGVIPTNLTRWVTVPYNCTITGFTMLTDVSTITVVDVMRCTYAEFDAGSTHPVIGDKITASLPPTINPSLYKTNVTSVATWSASLTNGNVIAFRTITNTAATTITLSLIVEHAP